MSDRPHSASTSVARLIAAPADAIYRAFLDPKAVATWLPPGTMRGEVHEFDAREGGALRMSLVYPDDDRTARGKTSARTDTFRARFVRLVPGNAVVWAARFESADPAFAGEMTVHTTFAPAEGGTLVTIRCENIPPGVRLEDNETGSRLTLDQLAAYVGG